MKVLVIPSWYPPDGGSFFREQSEAIAQQGVKIDVLSLRIKGIKDIFKNPLLIKKRNILKNKEDNLNVFRAVFFKYPLTEKYNIKPWSKKLLRIFERYVKKEGYPDVIHIHSCLWAGYAASMIAKKYNIPYVLTEHRSRFVENNVFAQKKVKPFHVECVKKSLKDASKIILVSEKLKKTLLNIEPEIGNRTIVIPNFIDTGFFKPNDIELPKRPFVFFSLGNLVYTKGMDILIKAFAILKQNYKQDVLLKIGGGGNELSKLKKLTAKYGLMQDIDFKGSLTRQQVVDEMNNSHAFVLATRFEAFGVVLIEAMSCGLPVVCTKSGGPENIINPENGYIVPVNAPTELAIAMQSMIENYSNFDKEKIRDDVIEKYGQDNVANRVISVYKELV